MIQNNYRAGSKAAHGLGFGLRGMYLSCRVFAIRTWCGPQEALIAIAMSRGRQEAQRIVKVAHWKANTQHHFFITYNYDA
mgnify:FL=1